MSYINSKTFVDVHTTGRLMEFGSVRSYDKFLKENGKVVLSKKDLEKISQPRQDTKSDYRKLAIEVWKDRSRTTRELKDRIAKQQYELRNGRK